MPLPDETNSLTENLLFHLFRRQSQTRAFGSLEVVGGLLTTTVFSSVNRVQLTPIRGIDYMATVKKLVMAAAGAAFLGLGVAGMQPASAQELVLGEETTIDFDDLEQGSVGPVLNAGPFQFFANSQGVETPNEPLNIVSSVDNSDFGSQPNALAADSGSGDTFNGTIYGRFQPQFEELRLFSDDFRISLQNVPVSDPSTGLTLPAIVLFDAGGSFVDDATLASSAVIEEIDMTRPGFRNVSLDFTDVATVSRFEILGDDVRIDNITFTPRAVPEPSSVLGTVAFGALGAGFMLKRKLKARKLAKVAN